jgi:hypothetical protein
MTFRSALNEAGVATGTARGFWGGVAPDGTIVVTGWRDLRASDGGYLVWRPRDNKGGLKAAWERGEIVVGAEVKLIVLKAQEELPIGQDRKAVAGKLMPGRWRVTELVDDEDWSAVVERVG